MRLSARRNELADIAYLAGHYEKTVLILNIANLVDTTELKKIKGLNAILLAGQAGNATGNIVADVVLGKSIPSGKLTDTWAASYEDYPSSKISATTTVTPTMSITATAFMSATVILTPST